MKKLKKLSALLLTVVMIFTLAFNITSTASAASHSSIYIGSGFDGSTFEFGETIKVPFTLYNLGYSWEQYTVEIRSETGDAFYAEKTDYFPTTSYITNLTLTFDSTDYQPGKYLVYYWCTYDTSHRYSTYIDFTIKEPVGLSYKTTLSGVQSGKKDNLSSAQSAWKATTGNLQRYDFKDSQPFQIRLEEIYFGEYGDAIARSENSSSATPNGDQHWIIMKFYLKNTGKVELEANDVISSYNSPFYTPTGASLSLRDEIYHFYGAREGMGSYDLTLYPGASGYFWVGILPYDKITNPYIKISNGYHKSGYTTYQDYTWLKTDFETLEKINGQWYYYKNGKRSYDTTLVNYNNKWYYVKNGIKNNSNTLVKYNNKWYHVNGGKWVKDTTLVKYNGTWYYVTGGIKNNANTLVNYNNKWYHVNGGKWVKDTTLVKYNNKWYYVKKGVKDNSNTLVKYNNKWYHVNGGKWVKDTAIVKYNGKRYYVKGGILQKVTKTVKVNGKYYKLKNGVVV